MAMVAATARAMAGSKTPRGTRTRQSSCARGRPAARRLLFGIAAALAALQAGAVWSAKWEIEPGVSLEETYTDNIALAPPGLERSDWVTTLTPRIVVHGTGERAHVDLNYAPQLLYWSNEGRTRTLQIYNAAGTIEFVKRMVFLDVRSSESQEIVSLFGPQPESNVNLTQNRTAVRTNSISPYVRQDFGGYAHADARVTYSTVESDADVGRSDSRATDVAVRLASGEAYKLLTWSVDYTKSHVDYKDPQFADVDIQKITAGVKRLITPQLALLAIVGYDDVDYINTGGPVPRGFLWSAGAEWNPSPRTKLAAAAGRRYFGTTGFFDFNHRTRLTVWKLSYLQDISTSTSDFLLPATVDTAGYLNTLFKPTIPDPALRLAAVNEFIARNGLAPSFGSPVNFLSSVPFLVKRLQGSAGIQGISNTVLLSVFSEKREALAPNQPGGGDLAVTDTTKQTGVDVAWTHALSPQTSATLSLGISRNEFADLNRTDNRKFARASVTRQFLPRVSGSLSYRRLVNSSSPDSGDGYRENAVVALLTARF